MEADNVRTASKGQITGHFIEQWLITTTINKLACSETATDIIDMPLFPASPDFKSNIRTHVFKLEEIVWHQWCSREQLQPAECLDRIGLDINISVGST